MSESPLARVRRSRGLAQTDIAQALGVSANTVSSWELGRTAPDAAQIWKLAQMLDSSPNELCGWTSPDVAPDVAEFAALPRYKRAAVMAMVRAVES